MLLMAEFRIIEYSLLLFNKGYLNIYGRFHLDVFIYQNEVNIDLVNIGLKMDLFQESSHLILVGLLLKKSLPKITDV